MNSNDIQNKINEMIKTNIDNLLDTKEVFNRITQNTMFNPISKVVLENIPPEYDIIHTYEYGLEHIEDIVKKEKVLDETIEVPRKTICLLGSISTPYTLVCIFIIKSYYLSVNENICIEILIRKKASNNRRLKKDTSQLQFVIS